MLSKLSSIPSKPGVYIFKNEKEQVLYVGKAKNLRSRLMSYFQKCSHLDPRKTAMIRSVKNFSFIVTDNELEALALEANLIKQYKPKFNVILRDDKNYPYLKLTVNEEWPRIEIARMIKKDSALYFGPYVPAGSMWETLAFIRRNFQIRGCRYSLDKPMRPCIQYQMGKCVAPCAGKISREEYLKLVNEIILFLKGEKKGLLKELEKRMLKFSVEMKFEEAAKIRDRIKALRRAWESQKVVAPELGDMDVIGYSKSESMVSLEIFFIRNGIMIGSKDLLMRNSEDLSDKEMMHSFISQFYSKEIIPPREILIPFLPAELRALGKWLSQRKEKKVKIFAPKTGKKKELLLMATENARIRLKEKKETKAGDMLTEIKEKLRLERLPKDIGAFDVSTISGNKSVGAFVYWKGGEFNKDLYRKLRIKTVRGVDDYAMMEEIVERIIRNLDENMPDLIIIDGGKGQLEISRKVLDRNRSLFPEPPMVIAIAKGPDRAFLPLSEEPVDLNDGKTSSLLLKRIRDEAHRFAIGYHRKLRGKGLMESPLEKIPGIGRGRRLILLRRFGSIEGVRNATIEEIMKLRGFHKGIAENILIALRREK